MNSPPSNDEVEISVFGPGIGESIVIHLGCREWVIVDSCCNESNKPTALEYLKHIGVNPSTEVKLIVSSHWHDDHIKGLSQIYAECSSARISCALALCQNEFCELVEAYGGDPTIKHRGVEEFYKIFSMMENLPVNDCRRNPIWAKENTVLITSSKYEVIALSPSDAAISFSQKDIATLLPTCLKPKKNLMIENANHAALVLKVNVGVWNILLASDLQANTNPLMGWSAIVHSKGRRPFRAQILKIPHHGSINGHSQDLWNNLVTEDPISIVTPYNRGAQKLPTQSDLERIAAKSNHLYYTGLPSHSTPKRRMAAVERTINQVALSRKVISPQMGHVRLRNNINLNTIAWKKELFGSASEFKL